MLLRAQKTPKMKANFILTILLEWRGDVNMVMPVLRFGGMKNHINNYIGNTGVYEETNTC